MKKNNSTLIAELGGTNARLSVTEKGNSLSESKQYLLSDFTSIEAPVSYTHLTLPTSDLV